MKEYKSRSYCKDIKCEIQEIIDEDNTGLEVGFAKGYCRNECSAYKFHKWLQGKGYKIIKGADE